MKNGLHPWGVFERGYRRKYVLGHSYWVLLSHHKTEAAAKTAALAIGAPVVCRISQFPHVWERRW